MRMNRLTIINGNSAHNIRMLRLLLLILLKCRRSRHRRHSIRIESRPHTYKPILVLIHSSQSLIIIRDIRLNLNCSTRFNLSDSFHTSKPRINRGSRNLPIGYSDIAIRSFHRNSIYILNSRKSHHRLGRIHILIVTNLLNHFHRTRIRGLELGRHLSRPIRNIPTARSNTRDHCLNSRRIICHHNLLLPSNYQLNYIANSY